MAKRRQANPKLMRLVVSDDPQISKQLITLKTIPRPKPILTGLMSSTKDDEDFDIYNQLEEKRDKRLSKYNVSLRYMTERTRKREYQLTSAVKRIKSAINLDIKCCETGQQHLIRTFLEMGRWTYLSSLHISFSYRTTSAYARDLSRGIQSLSSLCTLQLMLDLSGDEDTKDTLEFILDLRYLISLTSLSVILKDRKGSLTNKALKNIMESLRHLPLLTTLSLKFELCKKIINERLQDLPRSLRQLAFLTTLRLNFQSCSGLYDSESNSLIDKENSVTFFSVIKSLPILSNLTLKLKGSIGFNDLQIDSLSHCLRNFSALRTLKLHLINNRDFTDYSYQCLGYGLMHLKNLSTLKLRLAYFAAITDKNIENLFIASKDLTQLSAVALDFRRSDDIGAATITSLFAMLKQLPSLSKLKLAFGDREFGSDLSPQTFTSLCAGFKSLKTISFVQVIFEMSYVDDKQIKALIAILSRSTSLVEALIHLEKCTIVSKRAGLRRLPPRIFMSRCYAGNFSRD